MSPLTTPGRFDGALAKAALTTALLMTWALATSAMTWGLPDGRGWAPDEIIPGTVIEGLTMWFSDGWHSAYPPLHFYLLATVLLPFQFMAHVGLLDLSSTQTYLAMFLLQRGVSVVLAGATLYLVYPSPTVIVAVMSVPHITSGTSVVIVPSCTFGPCARPTRCGAWRSCSRINRRTRSCDVRIPSTRSFAQAFRYPSP